MSVLGPPLHRFYIYAFGGVEDAWLEGNEIVGRWKRNLNKIFGPDRGTLAADLANWTDTPDSILRFVKQYGPLRIKPQPGEGFRLPIAEWKRQQRFFRSYWDAVATLPREGPDRHLSEVQPDDWIGIEDRRFVYRTANLERLLHLDLVSCPRERIRKCGRDDCSHPYFIARHLRQQYCTKECSDWAQRRSRLKWWNRVGKKRKAKHQGEKPHKMKLRKRRK